MTDWINIEDQQPEDQQPVYYWFGVFNEICEGYFEICKDEYFEGSRIFYNHSGYLGDDVTWWMPREELPEGVRLIQNGPTKEQKAACKYHPYPRVK